MNERIVDLYEQSSSFASEEENSTKSYKDRVMIKFAQLIVQECSQTIIDNTPLLDNNEAKEDWNKGYDRAMKDCIHHIKEHFGVEE